MTENNPTVTGSETDATQPPARVSGHKAQQGAFGLAVLFGLGGRGRHVYGGTVPWETKQNRRAKNRAARKSRRINRNR